ncbi:fatty acyl-AMP ligase [Kribbella sp. NPDC056861]|uniref:fatty acyl-AMP ligase n=1 Tax=Kribbella sp. NPDC056861 TaxID=3154857 RepID=UPI003445B2EE
MTEMSGADSLVELLRLRALEQPDQLALVFLPDGSTSKQESWTYGELFSRAGAVALRLRREDRTTKPVVLALRPGLTFVAALFGGWMAGATVVPTAPPLNRRTAERLRSIAQDCRPGTILVDEDLRGRALHCASALAAVPAATWCVLDTSGTGHTDEVQAADPAMIQYSSGSTGEPKGVLLTHANLISNCVVLGHHIGTEADRVGLSWLPPYHDMGLIGTIMLAVHGGWPLVMMTPEHFVQDPTRWLRAITEFEVTITVAPNFAFALCAEHVTDEEVVALDLSSLRQVFCGSEPVSAATLTAFRERFTPAGYDERSLIPCYGLAEATLFVTGKAAGSEITLAPNGEVVSCGTVAIGHELAVTDESGAPLPDGEIGEIRVRGPNVATGYHGRPELTRRTFGADGWLRTGDLGCLRNGELFVTGRASDLMIVAGRNLYPQDVEESVLRNHPPVRRAVAFGIMTQDAEELVVMAEVRDVEDAARLVSAITATVATLHGVRPADVVLLPAGAIPVTTSGKVRRNPARDSYLAGVAS